MEAMKVLLADTSTKASNWKPLTSGLKKVGVRLDVTESVVPIMQTIASPNDYDVILIESSELDFADYLHSRIVKWGWDKGLIYFSRHPDSRFEPILRKTGGCHLNQVFEPSLLAERIRGCASGVCAGNRCHWIERTA